jgi:hypothetical protein
MQALITCWSSLCWIKPSPERHSGDREATTVGLTVQVVDFEQETDLVVGGLSGELVHRVQELLQRDRTRVVLVEDLEDSLGEEGLKTDTFEVVASTPTPHVFRDHDLLEVLPPDLLLVAHRLSEELLQSVQTPFVEARPRPRITHSVANISD